MAGTKYMIIMKRIPYVILFACLGFLLNSCEKYEEYMVDYKYSAVYFPHRAIDRSVIVGEYMEIGVGISLGGRFENNSEEWATFELDPDILTGTDYLLMPEAYYTMDNSMRITIPVGEFMGFTYVTVDPELFCADSLALTSTYALGFRLLETSVDSILTEMASTIISFKYINTYDGNYYHKGRAVGYSDGNPPDTMVYPKDDVWNLTTFSPDGVTAPEMGNISGDAYLMDLVVNPDNTVGIRKNPIADKDVTGLSGEYLPDSRTFILEYSFSHEGKDYTANDTLIFRNRIVDGVNQWDI
jgi:hypothetical protein